MTRCLLTVLTVVIALIAGLTLTACGGGDEADAPKRLDPEAAARVFFENHVFDEAATGLFVREAEPDTFALRHMVQTPDDFRFVDFWRVRTVDNRFVVEPLFELKGRPHVTTVWFEVQDEAWRVAGWTPDARPVDPAALAPSAGARVPIPFAPAAFRGAPPVVDVKVDPEWSNIRILDREIPMEALPRVLKAEKTCPRRLGRALEKQAKPLVDCYGVAFEEGPYRRGRMTFDFIVEGTGPDVSAMVAETTLIHPSLGNCVTNVLRFAEVPAPKDGASCKARVAVTFSPIDPAELEQRKKRRERERKRQERRRK